MKNIAILICVSILIFTAACRAADTDRRIEASANGYCGPIKMLITIDDDDKIKDIMIVSQNETPGAGSKICESGFLKQFNGKSADDLIAKRGVDAITGATVSSNAVIKAAGKAVKEYLSGHPSKLEEEKKVSQQ